MALPVPFDPQGFPIVNAIVAGAAPAAGGGIILPPGAITQVTTDAGSFQGTFPGASLYRAIGNCVFTAASPAVTGVGTAFLTTVRVGDYVELIADHSDTVPVMAQVQSIESNTALTLRTAYTGAGGAAGASQVCDWYVFRTANAGDAVGTTGGGAARLSVGAVNGSRVSLTRALGAGGRKGCAPIKFGAFAKVTASRANQVAFLGLASSVGSVAALTQVAYFDLGGGTATIARAGAAVNLSTGMETHLDATLSGAKLVTGSILCEIELRDNRALFYVGTELVYEAVALLPDPYQELIATLMIENVGAAGATDLEIPDVHVQSVNVVETRVTSEDPFKLRGVAIDVTPMIPGNTAPRAPTNVADNLVHEITDAAGVGMTPGQSYLVTQIGGAALQAYVSDAGAPAVATARRSPAFLFNGLPWLFVCPSDAVGLRIYAVKAVDGTADATVYCATSWVGSGA